MSRINDALKRAKQAQQKNPPPGLPKLLPAAPKPGNVIGWLLPGVIGFLIVAACLFIGLTLATRTATKAASQPKPMAAQPAPPAVTPTPDPAPNAPTPPPPPAPLEPKLQGIIYAATQPWAIVDGHTVHVGDRLGEFRVKAISPHDVTLEKSNGSQKKLGLDK